MSREKESKAVTLLFLFGGLIAAIALSLALLVFKADFVWKIINGEPERISELEEARKAFREMNYITYLGDKDIERSIRRETFIPVPGDERKSPPCSFNPSRCLMWAVAYNGSTKNDVELYVKSGGIDSLIAPNTKGEIGYCKYEKYVHKRQSSVEIALLMGDYSPIGDADKVFMDDLRRINLQTGIPPIFHDAGSKVFLRWAAASGNELPSDRAMLVSFKLVNGNLWKAISQVNGTYWVSSFFERHASYAFPRHTEINLCNSRNG